MLAKAYEQPRTWRSGDGGARVGVSVAPVTAAMVGVVAVMGGSLKDCSHF